MTTSDPAAKRHTVLVAEPILAGVVGRLSEYAVHKLWEEGDPRAYAAERGRDVEVIVTVGAALDPALIDSLPALKLIACFASGYEGVDVARARARGVEVTNGGGINHDDVADHAMALILAFHRNILAGDLSVRSGDWGKTRAPAPRAFKSLKVGVLGLGAIGSAIAERLTAFGCDIAWHGRGPKPDAPYPRKASLLELATWGDILVIAARADASNQGLIDAAIIDAVGAKGLIVNMARGSIIDEDALRSALKDGRLGGAALDVFAVEPTPPDLWRDVPRTLLSPHAAGLSDTAGAAMAEAMLENIRRVLDGRPPLSPIPAAE